MAVMNIQNKIPFWRLDMGNADSTNLMKKYINSLSIEYELNGIAKANVEVISQSYIEGIFKEALPIKIYMGWDRLNLIKMFEGELFTAPDGQAEDKLTYSLVATGRETIMTKITKQRTWWSSVFKSTIVKNIAAQYGYKSNVSIANNTAIPLQDSPAQKNLTDFEFLKKLAKNWNCLMWFHGNTLYFVDADKSHDIGNTIKEINTNDLKQNYNLGYRTNQMKNNVANIDWKFIKSKGVIKGLSSVEGMNEKGKKITKEDFDIEVDGNFYEIRPNILGTGVKNSDNWWKITEQVMAEEISGFKNNSFKKYFVLKFHGKNTRSSHAPKHKTRGIELNIDLNIGDPYIRPPRIGYLVAGVENVNSRMSDLPAFLYRSGKPQKYYINKVATSLSAGMIRTKLTATL